MLKFCESIEKEINIKYAILKVVLMYTQTINIIYSKHEL
jgi:hypothetical protein